MVNQKNVRRSTLSINQDMRADMYSRKYIGCNMTSSRHRGTGSNLRNIKCIDQRKQPPSWGYNCRALFVKHHRLILELQAPTLPSHIGARWQGKKVFYNDRGVTTWQSDNLSEHACFAWRAHRWSMPQHKVGVPWWITNGSHTRWSKELRLCIWFHTQYTHVCCTRNR